MKRTIKEQDFSYRKNNYNQLLETHVSMFDYDGLPETVNPYFLELYLQTEGIVVWVRDDSGDIITIEGTTAADLDVYGIGREVIAVTRNGKEYRRERDVDCVVGYNNRTMTPCGDIITDAATLAEIQTSIEFLIFWTRLSPLVRTQDEKTKEKVIEAFQNIRKGIPVTMVSKKVLAEFGIPDDVTIDMLTQPDFADKIQYTAKLYDDVLRWHMTRYGHATNGNSKAAQQTVDEVDSTASQSMILPLSMLKARREMLDKVNALYDTNITVELSGAWRAEVTAYENMSGEDSIDESADDTIDSDDMRDAGGSDDSDTLSDSDAAAQPDEPATEQEETSEAVTDAIIEAAEIIADAIEPEPEETEDTENE